MITMGNLLRSMIEIPRTTSFHGTKLRVGSFQEENGIVAPMYKKVVPIYIFFKKKKVSSTL
jgi:hypothetical protein